MSSVEEFRTEVRGWLRAHLAGEFAALKGRGGPGRRREAFTERLAWERHMAAHGWTCIGWPVAYGGRGASTAEHVCAAPSLLADGAHGDPYDLDDWQRLFLFSRADTIYAGSDEIQRTLIAERILGLPQEVRA
ncbi:acyl-CoA dehydrogenase family protein [Streptomyces sp. NPDC097617]|uniref:acyl-CoA dehydrogenase family protein n=1 Tax=Streptomyces sp. NPDC097617 TaxID=3366091 RepID=UPI0037FC9B1F